MTFHLWFKCINNISFYLTVYSKLWSIPWIHLVEAFWSIPLLFIECFDIYNLYCFFNHGFKYKESAYEKLNAVETNWHKITILLSFQSKHEYERKSEINHPTIPCIHSLIQNLSPFFFFVCLFYALLNYTELKMKTVVGCSKRNLQKAREGCDNTCRYTIFARGISPPLQTSKRITLPIKSTTKPFNFSPLLFTVFAIFADQWYWGLSTSSMAINEIHASSNVS